MTDREALIAQLLLHEGLRLTLYSDSLGIPTIGVGRNLRDTGITKDEALMLLNHDIDECVADLATFPWFRDLDAVRQRALLDFRFNLGPKKFRDFKRMLRGLETQDYALAARSMKESLWARQVKRRADRVVRMMATGQDV